MTFGHERNDSSPSFGRLFICQPSDPRDAWTESYEPNVHADV